MDNDTLNLMMNHRSIRYYKDEKLTQEQIDTLVLAAQHASNSTFSQQSSIISVTDQETKDQIAKITHGPWMKSSGHYFVMLVDQFRNLQISKGSGKDDKILRTTDKFLAGVFDAAIATENIVLAAESMGLGATVMGSVLNNSKKMIEMLKLPELTFPVLGISIGYPKNNPQRKPRLPENLVHFENGYQLPKGFHKEISDYDKKVAAYYNGRSLNSRDDTFTNHIVSVLETNINQRADLMTNIKAQGFLMD